MSWNNNVDNQRKKLLGRWKKITEAKCSEIYPDDLEFKDKGSYVGKKGQKATKHPYWDVGTYQILTEDQVRISTANDAQVIYKFSVLVDILIFIDGNGCEFRYQRIE